MLPWFSSAILPSQGEWPQQQKRIQVPVGFKTDQAQSYPPWNLLSPKWLKNPVKRQALGEIIPMTPPPAASNSMYTPGYGDPLTLASPTASTPLLLLPSLAAQFSVSQHRVFAFLLILAVPLHRNIQLFSKMLISVHTIREVLRDRPVCRPSRCLASALSWHWGLLEFKRIVFWGLSVTSRWNLTYAVTQQEDTFSCSLLLPQSWVHVRPRVIFCDVFVERMSERSTLSSFFGVCNAYEVAKHPTAVGAHEKPSHTFPNRSWKDPFYLCPVQC